MRGRRRVTERIRRGPGLQRPLAVDRLAHRIDHAAEQPADGRTAAGDALTMARQPRRTPSSAAKGISKALGPENPTTSQGIGALASMTMRAPTDMAWIGPATSTIRPRTPTTRP